MDDHTSKPKEAGRRGPVFLFIVAVLACGFFAYQGIARRHRLEWLAAVKSLKKIVLGKMKGVTPDGIAQLQKSRPDLTIETP